jgi:hypothetical protein
MIIRHPSLRRKMTNDTTVTNLPLADIKVDPACQTRAAMNNETIDEYVEVMKEKGDGPFPAVVVFHDGTDYWLSDGFHRHAAAKKAGLASLKSKIRQGTHRETILHSVGANTTHGLRRTNADKRRAVSILLHDEEWSTWSNREVARRCGVDEWLVRKLREEQHSMSPSAVYPQIARKVERKGTRYQMKTDNKIGKTDERAEQSPLRPDPNDQPEQVWDHTRQPAETDANAAELSDDEPMSSSEQPCSSDEVQLQELLSAWARASREIRQQFLAKIGVSPSPQAEAGRGLTDPEPSEESDPSQKQELSVMSSATELLEKLFEMWMGLNGHTQTYGRMWVETGCPAEYHPSENPYITDKLVPFRAAVCAATQEQQQQLSELLKRATIA